MKKKVMIYGAGVLMIAVLVGVVYGVMNRPQVYEVTAATTQDITETVAADGEIIANHETTYYTKVTAPIEGLTVKVGDYVEAGQQICTYDTEDLETAVTRAALIQKINDTAQNALLEQDAKMQQKLSESTTKYEQACIYEDFFQSAIDQFEDQLYQISLEQQIYDQLKAEVDRKQAFVTHEMQDPDQDADDIEDANDALLQKTLALNDQEKKLASYDTASIKECMSDCQQELDHWKEEKTKEENRKEEDDNNTLTGSGKSNAQAVKENSAFDVSEAEKELSKGQNAITVEKAGIVTELLATDGETLMDGAPVLTIADHSDLAIRVDVSKYDMDKIKVGQQATVTIGNHTYDATVSRIDQVAAKDDANKPKVFVEANISNPDEYVLIGLEADITITTNTVPDACVVPNEAVYTLDDGTYIYQVNDNKLIKTQVITGCSNDKDTEILEGVTAGDEVIISAVSMEDVGNKAAIQ